MSADELEALVRQIEELPNWSHVDRIKLFAWHLHRGGTEAFSGTEIRQCYQRLNMEQPANFSSLLAGMEGRRPRDILRKGNRFVLERRIREDLNSRYGERSATVQVHALLRALPENVPDLTERTYLEEAIICFRHSAYRAAIVMAWNLVYDHLLTFVIKMHLPAFNAQFAINFPKKAFPITHREDFEEVKEADVIQICYSAGLTSSSVHKVLREKLARRNLAAHPSSAAATQLTAEEYIHDILTNVMFKIGAPQK